MEQGNQNETVAEEIFRALYRAKTEKEVDKVLEKYPQIFGTNQNWHPLGENDSNFGVIENQQSSPIAALIEKLTNSIDAILTKKCYEAGIDPKSSQAPRSIEEGVERFFPDCRSWDLSSFRKA